MAEKDEDVDILTVEHTNFASSDEEALDDELIYLPTEPLLDHLSEEEEEETEWEPKRKGSPAGGSDVGLAAASLAAVMVALLNSPLCHRTLPVETSAIRKPKRIVAKRESKCQIHYRVIVGPPSTSWHCRSSFDNVPSLLGRPVASREENTRPCEVLCPLVVPELNFSVSQGHKLKSLSVISAVWLNNRFVLWLQPHNCRRFSLRSHVVEHATQSSIADPLHSQQRQLSTRRSAVVGKTASASCSAQ